ncbi:MAG: ankyrin repeat domain-containing protein, partial [Gammaproteobacteria bacterium]
MPNKVNFTYFIQTVRQGDLELVKEILSTEPDWVNKKTGHEQRTGLMYAIVCQKGEVAKLLLEHGAKWQEQDIWGNDALSLALLWGGGQRKAFVTLLQQHGAVFKNA